MSRTIRLLCLLLLVTACSDPAPPARPATLSLDAILNPGATEGYATATQPRAFRFPQDHGEHPRYRAEWWYLTGNLADARGARFGYQFTLFRMAIAPEPLSGASAWRSEQVYLAHTAVTDVAHDRFLQDQRASRGALDLAGVQGTPFRAWVENWQLRAHDGCVDCADFDLVLAADGFRVALRLVGLKPPVAQGEDGLSYKNRTHTSASYYYSLPRLASEGTIEAGNESAAVSGESWFDHEWSTSSLAPTQGGWDWFALQLANGSELMLFQIRDRDDRSRDFRSGSYIDRAGTVRRLEEGEIRVLPLGSWRSARTGVTYPARWRLELPSLDGALEVSPLIADQEIDLALRYWEGAVQVDGKLAGETCSGRGYVELTGYEAPSAAGDRP